MTFPEWLSGTEPLPHTPGAVLVVFVVFCVHMHSFAGLIRRTPPPTFSDTAITDRHSDTTIFQLRAHWVRISWSAGSEKSFGPGGSRTLDFLRASRAPYPLGQALRCILDGSSGWVAGFPGKNGLTEPATLTLNKIISEKKTCFVIINWEKQLCHFSNLDQFLPLEVFAARGLQDLVAL